MSQAKLAPSRVKTGIAAALVALIGFPASLAAVRYGDGGWLTLVGAVLILCVMALMVVLLRRFNDCGPMPAPARRYMQRFIPAMVGYMLVLFGSLWTIRHLQPQGPILWVLGVAPALPIIAAIAAMGMYLVEETDEFQRAILVQSMLWGLGVTMSVCTAWGFLENVELVAHLPLYLVFPMFCGTMGLAQPLVRRSYR